MFLKLINWVAAWFGYRWVLDNRTIANDAEDFDDLIDDEGWDDIEQHNPRYRLEKIDKNSS